MCFSRVSEFWCLIFQDSIVASKRGAPVTPVMFRDVSEERRSRLDICCETIRTACAMRWSGRRVKLTTYLFVSSFIHSDNLSYDRRVLHRVRSNASSFNFQYLLVSLTLILLMWRIWWAPNNASKWQMGFNSAFKGLKSLLSSCLRFLPRPSLSSIFSSIMCYTRLFLRSMRSIDLAFLIFLV